MKEIKVFYEVVRATRQGELVHLDMFTDKIKASNYARAVNNTSNMGGAYVIDIVCNGYYLVMVNGEVIESFSNDLQAFRIAKQINGIVVEVEVYE